MSAHLRKLGLITDNLFADLARLHQAMPVETQHGNTFAAIELKIRRLLADGGRHSFKKPVIKELLEIRGAIKRTPSYPNQVAKVLSVGACPA